MLSPNYNILRLLSLGPMSGLLSVVGDLQRYLPICHQEDHRVHLGDVVEGAAWRFDAMGLDSPALADRIVKFARESGISKTAYKYQLIF